MNGNKQKLIIENLLSSADVFSKCVPILNPSYFDPEYRPVIKFLLTYFNKYHNTPSTQVVNAEFDSHNFTPRQMTFDELSYTCDEIEKFCQEEALISAIIDSNEDITSGDRSRFGKVLQRVQLALAISLQKDMGIDMYDNIADRLRSFIDTVVGIPTGIAALDEALDGGLYRRQLTLFSANSGGGKSIMLSNLGANFAARGLHVLQISLELPESMITIRNAAIMSGLPVKSWKENIPEIAERIENHKASGGSFRIKRMAGGSTANDIRAYLKHYELEFGHGPDVLIVDYLDLMKPVGGSKQMSISEEDKLKSEQLSEILFDYNCVGVSASQQNREALRLASPDQGVIAGGISKVNTVDNYISIFMDPGMRIKGDMLIFYLKTRSASAVGSSSMLKFNAETLQITDSRKGSAVYTPPSTKTQLYNELTDTKESNEVESPDALIELINKFNI